MLILLFLGPEVKAEFNEMRVGLAEEIRATEGLKKRELLEPANRYRLFLGFFMFCGQQCTGMTALAYFGPQFFKLIVGNDSSRSLLITGLFGAEKFITVFIYIFFFSESWGRKPTLWITALIMSMLFVIVTIVSNTTPKPDKSPTPAGIATVALIFLTNSVYQFGWGPLPWPYTTEIFPSRIREIGSSVSVCSQWLFNFLFSLVTPYMQKSWGSYVFLFYAVLDLIMAVLVWFFVKETRGKSLEEMETIFNSKAAFDVEVARHDGIEPDNISALEVPHKQDSQSKCPDSSD